MSSIATHIRNPLTVISIFATLAETGGSVALPFLSPTTQATYVWFLMLFPPFLVLLFFATLIYDHTVLYAPSDYKDERNFNRFRTAKPQQVLEKIRENAIPMPASVTLEGSPKARVDSSEPDPTFKIVDREMEEKRASAERLRASIWENSQAVAESRKMLAEELVITAISREYNLVLARNQVSQDSDYVFDAISKTSTSLTIVEVMDVPEGDRTRFIQQLHRVLTVVRRHFEVFQRSEWGAFTFILAIVTNSSDEAWISGLRSIVGDASARYAMPITPEIYTYESLGIVSEPA